MPEPVKPSSLLARRTGHVRFDDVGSPTSRTAVILPRLRPGHPGRADDRARRLDGCGQVDAGEADRALLRPDRGRGHARRRRPAGPATEGPAPRDRDGDAGGVPVQRARSPTTSRSASRTRPATEIEAAARAVGADEFIRALPDGYDTDVNKRGGRVSAGQRQLISFARAFLADPAVLILDEATASLDIPSERLVQEALQTLLADRTAVIIAHRLSTVAIADRVLVMEHGRIVEDGTPDDLIAGTGRFAQLHAAWRSRWCSPGCAPSDRIPGRADRAYPDGDEGATRLRWGRGFEVPPPVSAWYTGQGEGCQEKRISAITSVYSVSPTGVKPTRWKNASGPPSPGS